MSFELSKFQLTEQQTHAIIIVVLLIVTIILIVLVVKAAKKEKFRYRAVGATGGLSARLRGAKKNRIQIKEGFGIEGSSNGGTFNQIYSEDFVAGQTGQGAAGLKAEGFSPMIDNSGLKSHLRTKQRIIY
jgi:hypothetical protein